MRRRRSIAGATHAGDGYPPGTAQGHQDVHDVKFDHGLWEADARNPDGKKVDLLADPDDGSVVAIGQD